MDVFLFTAKITPSPLFTKRCYFNNTIFLVCTNSPACILYKYTPALTGMPMESVASHWTDLKPASWVVFTSWDISL
ncbi:uncharacterized protein METZ01_LOCUS133982, partial [marine metagenome]